MKKPNVILIVMDTVRADHLSCYGYHRKTTPNIDKIAREGALFKNAFSTAPWTPPSHASIFTGKYPSHHKTLGKNIYLKSNNTPLPKILSRHGYESLGVTCCSLLGLESGFDKDFQQYFDIIGNQKVLSNLTKNRLKALLNALFYGPDKGAFQANEIVKLLLKRKHHSRNGKKPFFVFINYFECHTAYDPPRPFKKKFCKNFDASSLYLKELILKKTFNKTLERFVDPDLDIQKLQWIASGEGGFAFVTKEISISKKEWDVVKSWYDGEISYLDSCIGELIEFLRLNEILDDTLLIITSDHGENLGDHGLAVHPLCVYDSLLHVPLIMRYPSSILQGKKFENLVSTIDIFPTVLDIAKIKNSKEIIDGKSLHPFQDRKIHDLICAEYEGFHRRAMGAPSTNKLDEIDRPCKCIRDSTYKYIFSPQKEELYNIREDPLEKINIISTHREDANSLKRELEKTIDISYFGPQDFPYKKGRQKMLDRLKTLGYM